MKIGLQLYLGGEAGTPEFLAPAAKAIEERGFHEIWLAEHIVLFPELTSAYPYSADGSFPFDTKLLPLEPFTAMAFIAAHTSTVRLATGISVLPQRNPVFAAKQVADVDVLSGGRVDYGIGAGWCLEEIEALGTPTAKRGARTDDYLRLMKALWTQELTEYDGPFYSLPPCHTGPKPVQRPHPPIIVGGISKAAMRRVARLGNGWFCVAKEPDEFAESVSALHEICVEEERLPGDIRLVASPPSGKAPLDVIKAYRDAGADQVVLALAGRGLDRFLSRLDEMAEQIVAPAAAL